MELDIYLIFENNKIKFNLNLPISFIGINRKEYINIQNKTIYECYQDQINFDIFNRNLNKITKKINKIFYLGPRNQDKISFNNYYIFFDKQKNQSCEFIKNNKNLNIMLRIDEMSALVNNLGDIDYPNLKILFNNSDEAINYKDFYLMYKKLNEVTLFVKHYNLSPLEITMLVYDIVKANEYKKESDGENYRISRNLNEIVNSGKIVCVGYANLVNFFLNNLRIECHNLIVSYIDKKTKHERNYVYLKDYKYNINKILFLDATWDSKKNEKYIDNYTYFLKPLYFFKLINNNEKLENNLGFKILYNRNRKEIFDYIKQCMLKDKIRICVNLNTIFSKFNITKNENLLVYKPLINTEIIDIVNKLIPIGFKGISKESFKNALYKVRRIEYLNKIIPFEPNEEYIDSVCNKFYRKTAEEKLLAKIFGETKESLDKALVDANATSVEEDLLRIRLIKALKENLNDFPDNDYIKKM